jgi:hypothetical protein
MSSIDTAIGEMHAVKQQLRELTLGGAVDDPTTHRVLVMLTEIDKALSKMVQARASDPMAAEAAIAKACEELAALRHQLEGGVAVADVEKELSRAIATMWPVMGAIIKG